MSQRPILKIAVLCMLAAAAPPGYAMSILHGRNMMRGGVMGNHSVRHFYVIRHGVPSAYANLKNPLPPTEENLGKGKLLYSQVCASCHGSDGKGNGPAAKGMDPPPVDLTHTALMPLSSDGYLYWTIAEGGADLNTAMPAMKDSLTANDIWKLILHLRTFQPRAPQ